MPLPLSSEALILLCGAIDGELRALVAAHASGRLTEPQFVDAMLRIETERAARYGLTLTASHTYDEWTVVNVRLSGSPNPCASFEFQPASGRYRDVGAICRCRDPRLPPLASKS